MLCVTKLLMYKASCLSSLSLLHARLPPGNHSLSRHFISLRKRIVKGRVEVSQRQAIGSEILSNVKRTYIQLDADILYRYVNIELFKFST